MSKRGSIIHNGKRKQYEVDQFGDVWLKEGNVKTNIGQVKPIDPNNENEIKDLVEAMLISLGK